MIKWEVSLKDARRISAISKRALKLIIDNDLAPDTSEKGLINLRRDIDMDITACHANGCPLQLAELAKARDADFGHDVLGIRRFIDRRTGTIPGELFWPRYAAPENTEVVA